MKCEVTCIKLICICPCFVFVFRFLFVCLFVCFFCGISVVYCFILLCGVCFCFCVSGLSILVNSFVCCYHHWIERTIVWICWLSTSCQFNRHGSRSRPTSKSCSTSQYKNNTPFYLDFQMFWLRVYFVTVKTFKKTSCH